MKECFWSVRAAPILYWLVVSNTTPNWPHTFSKVMFDWGTSKLIFDEIYFRYCVRLDSLNSVCSAIFYFTSFPLRIIIIGIKRYINGSSHFQQHLLLFRSIDEITNSPLVVCRRHLALSKIYTPIKLNGRHVRSATTASTWLTHTSKAGRCRYLIPSTLSDRLSVNNILVHDVYFL